MEFIDAKIVRREALEEETGIHLSDCIECAIPIDKEQDFFSIGISDDILKKYIMESYKNFCAGELKLVIEYANSIEVIKTLREQYPDTKWIIVANF